VRRPLAALASYALGITGTTTVAPGWNIVGR